MRRLLALPLRWLDARIDARIAHAERLKVEGVLVLIRAGRTLDEQAAETVRRKIAAGMQPLADEAAQDLRGVTALNDAAAPKRGGGWMGA